MTEHVCEWRVLKPEPTEPDWYIWCPECGDRMDTIEEIESRLNAYWHMRTALFEIGLQASRHKRASNLKCYLLADLEEISSLVERIYADILEGK